jgi:hypothetical protein
LSLQSFTRIDSEKSDHLIKFHVSKETNRKNFCLHFQRLFSYTHFTYIKLGEIQSLSASNKILSDKLSDQYLKFSREEINSKELEKKIFLLEDNLKKFRKVMFEKELGDRKIISDLKHNLSNASQLIRLNEMNKKAEVDKKNEEISEIEKIRAVHDSRLQQVRYIF